MSRSSSETGVLEDLYREVILKHYHSPANRRSLPDANARGYSVNPLCGDEMTVAARIDKGCIADAAFEARGCSISQASADMMADAIRGKTVEEVAALVEWFRGMMLSASGGVSADLGDLGALQGVKKYPVRIKCALLPWDTLADALTEFRVPSSEFKV